MSRRFYALALLSAFLGAAGAAADVAWHFSRLFDEFSPPHDVATAGMILNIVLLYWALWRHRERLGSTERTGLMLNAAGVAIFLVVAPLDLLVHLIYGIDITTWSPTHLGLFYSAVLGLCGLLLAWVASPEGRGRGAWLLTGGIGVFLLSATLFPAYQQEYAAVALRSLQLTGHAPWYVAPDMWRLAGPNAQNLAHGNVPDWLYPVYIATCVAFSLGLVSALVRGHWVGRATRVPAWYGLGAATGVLGAYLLFRLTARAIFHWSAMPTSELPWWELPLAVGIDLALFVAAALPDVALPRWVPLAGVVPDRARVAALAAGLGAAVGTVGLSLTMELLRTRGDTVPANPGGAVVAALLAAALAAACGATLGARMLVAAEAERAGGRVAGRQTRGSASLAGVRTFGHEGRVAQAVGRALHYASSRVGRG